MGFNWVRQLFQWRDIEGACKGCFDWTESDRVVKASAQAGVKIIARLDFEPLWIAQQTSMYVAQMRNVESIFDDARPQRSKKVRACRHRAGCRRIGQWEFWQCAMRFLQTDPNSPIALLDLKDLRTCFGGRGKFRMSGNMRALPGIRILPAMVGADKTIGAAILARSLLA